MFTCSFFFDLYVFEEKQKDCCGPVPLQARDWASQHQWRQCPSLPGESVMSAPRGRVQVQLIQIQTALFLFSHSLKEAGAQNYQLLLFIP